MAWSTLGQKTGGTDSGRSLSRRFIWALVTVRSFKTCVAIVTGQWMINPVAARSTSEFQEERRKKMTVTVPLTVGGSVRSPAGVLYSALLQGSQGFCRSIACGSNAATSTTGARRKAMIPEIADSWPRPQGDKIRSPSNCQRFYFWRSVEGVVVRPVVVGHGSRYPPSFLQRGQK